MQPQLTDCARQSLNDAQSEARALNQEFVGTEHLFLGLLKTDGCLLGTLRSQHIDHDRVRATLLSEMPRQEQVPVITGDLPLSPKAQRALNAAIVRAMSLREHKVSTRILMLSLMEDSNGLFESALRKGGGDVDVLRQALTENPLDGET